MSPECPADLSGISPGEFFLINFVVQKKHKSETFLEWKRKKNCFYIEGTGGKSCVTVEKLVLTQMLVKLIISEEKLKARKREETDEVFQCHRLHCFMKLNFIHFFVCVYFYVLKTLIIE